MQRSAPISHTGGVRAGRGSPQPRQDDQAEQQGAGEQQARLQQARPPLPRRNLPHARRRAPPLGRPPPHAHKSPPPHRPRGLLRPKVPAYTGRPWQVRDILLIAPMTSPPAEQFRWFNNDEEGGHHLIDHWAWYAAVAGFSRARSATWLAAYAGAAALPLAVGLALGLPTVPGPAVRALRQPVARRRRHAAAR